MLKTKSLDNKEYGTNLTTPMQQSSNFVMIWKWVAKKVNAPALLANSSLMAQHRADPSSVLVPRPSSSIITTNPKKGKLKQSHWLTLLWARIDSF